MRVGTRTERRGRRTKSEQRVERPTFGRSLSSTLLPARRVQQRRVNEKYDRKQCEKFEKASEEKNPRNEKAGRDGRRGRSVRFLREGLRCFSQPKGPATRTDLLCLRQGSSGSRKGGDLRSLSSLQETFRRRGNVACENEIEKLWLHSTTVQREACIVACCINRVKMSNG